MTAIGPLTRRRIIFWSLLALTHVGAQPVFAGDEDDEDDDDNSGSGGGDDDHDDDNSGSGGGGDDDDEDSGSGGDGGGNGGGGGGGGNGGVGADDDDDDDDNSGSGGGGGRQIRDITLRYSDGWVELIRNGQYQLIDNLGRSVILRQATQEDFLRMAAMG